MILPSKNLPEITRSFPRSDSTFVTFAGASMSEAEGEGTNPTLVAIGGTIGGVGFVALGTLLVCMVVRG